MLSGRKIKNAQDMESAAEKIVEEYGCAVLLKGGHRINDANDFLCTGEKKVWICGERVENPNTHGTGCTLSSAIALESCKRCRNGRGGAEGKRISDGGIKKNNWI